MSSETEHLLRHALHAVIKMRPEDVIAAEQAVNAIRTLPIGDYLPMEPQLRQLRAAALRSAELWHMYSATSGGSGYTNDGRSMEPVIPSELSLKI